MERRGSVNHRGIWVVSSDSCVESGSWTGYEESVREGDGENGTSPLGPPEAVGRYEDEGPDRSNPADVALRVDGDGVVEG